MGRRFPACSLPASFAGGLPAVAITGGFTFFWPSTTNPQFQNPSSSIPKVNFTWIKGNHSLKFGYEYEHIWMGVLRQQPALRLVYLWWRL